MKKLLIIIMTFLTFISMIAILQDITFWWFLAFCFVGNVLIYIFLEK